MRLLALTLLLLFTPASGDKPLSLPTAARTQIGVTTTYDPAYVSLNYPSGDLPADRGLFVTCTPLSYECYSAKLNE
jgi:uncharacterized protein YijF (DUF1287 family)